jgi:hypothetical protein
VHIPRTNDTGRDRRRLRRIHAAFMGYPGKDSFSIVIEGAGKPNIMDFPNHTTGMCEALMKDLRDIVDEESIRIHEKS